MQFVVTKQIAVEADTLEDAVAKMGEGKTITLSVGPRVQPPQRPPAAPAKSIAAEETKK